MSSNLGLFSATLGKKLIMALSGLFLILFLMAHLAGNFSLLSDDGEAFNQYAHFMKHNPIIIVGEVVMFLGFIIHIVQGIALWISNKKARSQGYAVSHKHKKVNPFSKIMGPLGMIILIFLILHLLDFFIYKYFLPGGLSSVTYDGVEMPDLYSKVIHEFTDEAWIHIPIYIIAMFAISFHLNHGFQSAFQTIGWNHKKYTPIIKTIGLAYAILIPAAFAAIPIIIYAKSL